MKKAFQPVGIAACLWAVLVMSGGQWLALQSIAWVRMTVEFAQQDSLTVALAKTFSGRHPCALCLKVQHGLHQQKQQEQKMPWLKIEKMPEGLWEIRCLTAPPLPTAPRHDPTFASESWFGFAESPPTPPPRA